MMGCLAQLEEGQQIARKFEVDVLLGPGSLLDIGAALESTSASGAFSSKTSSTTTFRRRPPASCKPT